MTKHVLFYCSHSRFLIWTKHLPWQLSKMISFCKVISSIGPVVHGKSCSQSRSWHISVYPTKKIDGIFIVLSALTVYNSLENWIHLIYVHKIFSLSIPANPFTLNSPLSPLFPPDLENFNVLECPEVLYWMSRRNSFICRMQKCLTYNNGPVFPKANENFDVSYSSSRNASLRVRHTLEMQVVNWLYPKNSKAV